MSFNSIKVLAPAKINLSLDIVRKRDDGYHDVSMVMQAVSLYDTVTVEENESGEITISCNNPEIPCDERNIVYKAAKEFFKYTKNDLKGLNIDIQKVIPSQAGLAGGSTDGAAVLFALNMLYDTHLKSAQLCEIAQYVGSDVPFCIDGGTQHATNTGTTLKKLVPLPKCYFVICKPEVNVSTKEAYALFDSKTPKGFLYTDEVIKMLFRRDVRGIAPCMFNEFETLMNIDEVNELKKLMRKNKAIGASMSGSGSAVFGMFLSEKHANKCCELLKQSYNEVFVCQPIKNGCKVL